MAKNRCPSCGAAHKEPPCDCRLCGYVMDGSVEPPTRWPRTTPGRWRQEEGRGQPGHHRRARGGCCWPAGALALHVTSGGSTVEQGRREDPGPAGVTTTAGRRSPTPRAGSPSSCRRGRSHLGHLRRRPTTASSPAGSATIGRPPRSTRSSTSLYGKVHPAPGEAAEDTVTAGRRQDGRLDGGIIESRTAAPPSRATRPSSTRSTACCSRAATGYENALLFLKGDELYVVQSLSIYSGNPADAEFNQVLDSMQVHRLTDLGR